MSRKSMSRKSVSRKSMSRKSMSRKSMSRKSIKKEPGGKKTPPTASEPDKSIPEDVLLYEAPITVTEFEPCIKLLFCKEPPIIFMCIDAIYDYIKKNPEEAPPVLKKDVLGVLKIYAQSDLQFIPLRALKLLAELSQFPESHESFTSDPDFLRFLYKCYIENNDSRWKDPASGILSEITKHVEVAKSFLNLDYVDIGNMIKMLKNSDPDVINNTMKMIMNMFQDVKLAEKFVNTPDFMFNTLFPLYESPYVEIQNNSLFITHWLVYQPQTDDLKKLFLDEGGVDRLYNILLNRYAWRDLHPVVLDILQVVYNNEERVASLKDDGLRKLVEYLDFIENDDLIAKAMNVIVQWSRMIFGRYMLLKLGMLRICVGYLSDGTFEMKTAACQFLNNVALDREKLRKLCEHMPMDQVVELITNKSHPLKLVTSANILLNNLIKFSKDDLALCLKTSPSKDKMAAWIMESYESMPPVNKRLMINTLSITAQNTITYPHFFNYDLITFLTTVIHETSEDLYDVTVVAAEALYYLIMSERSVRQYLFAKGGLKQMVGALWSTKNPELREMLCRCFIETIKLDELMKLKLLKDNCLSWITANKVLWGESQSMPFTVETFFENYLPVKFAYGSRLGFEDKIHDGFYMYKENHPPSTLPFPFTDDEIKDYSVYMVGFEDPVIPDETIEILRNERIRAQNEECVRNSGVETEMVQWHHLGHCINKDDDYLSLKDKLTVTWKADEDLNNYLQQLKDKVNELDEKEILELMEEFKVSRETILEAKSDLLKPMKPGDVLKVTDFGNRSRAALKRAIAREPRTYDLVTSIPGQPPLEKELPEGFEELPEEYEYKICRDKIPYYPIPKPFEPKWIIERINAITDVVIDAMTVPKEKEPCTYHTFNLFLEDLKHSLNSNVVPLGRLKVGTKLERAFLFKVLADKVGLPCTLVRGDKGQGWNEVCIMEEDDASRGVAKMPLRLLYPTHVVDLWNNPGSLLAVGTPDYRRYCGLQLNAEAYTKEDWMVH